MHCFLHSPTNRLVTHSASKSTSDSCSVSHSSFTDSPFSSLCVPHCMLMLDCRCSPVSRLFSAAKRCFLASSSRLYVCASPAREVSLSVSSMSSPVIIIVISTSSSEIMWNVLVISAYCAHSSARVAAIAFRSMHGTCTSPFTGSQVSPSMCSNAIPAEYSICSVVPPSRKHAAPAAIAQAVPTSAWQPASAPEIDALTLARLPITPATASASMQSSSVMLGWCVCR